MEVSKKQIWIIRIFFLLSIIQGVFVFVINFDSYSMKSRAFLFGYSIEQLVMGLLIFLVIILLYVFVHKSFFNIDWGRKLIEWLFEEGLEKHRLINWILGFTLLGIMMYGVYRYFPLMVPFDFPDYLAAAYDRLTPLILWAILFSFQFIIGVFVYFPFRYWKKILLGGGFDKYFIFLLFSSAILHWEVLLIRIRIFNKIPKWFVQFSNRGFHLNYFIYPALLIVVFGFIYYIFKDPNKIIRNIVLIMLLGIGLQLSMAMTEGPPFLVLQNAYNTSTISGILGNVCSDIGIVESIVRYEEISHSEYWLKTKSPGMLALYKGFRALFDIFPRYSACRDNFIFYASYLFPMVSMIVVIFIFEAGRKFYTVEQSMIASCLFVFTPNIVLRTIIFDQVIYPLVFMIGVWLIIKNSALRRSFLSGIGIGVYLYLAIFLSFSMLPLLGFLGIWEGIKFIRQRDQKTIYYGVGVFVGFLILLFLFDYYLNYDLFHRYEIAFGHHRSIKGFQGRITTDPKVLLLNLTEMSVWIGFPMMLLFLRTSLNSIKNIFSKNILSRDIYIISVFTTLLALNILGQTNGEVGRIWMFLVPMFSLVAYIDVKELIGGKKAIYTVAVLQLVTIFFNWQFYLLNQHIKS